VDDLARLLAHPAHRVARAAAGALAALPPEGTLALEQVGGAVAPEAGTQVESAAAHAREALAELAHVRQRTPAGAA
jgi:hypothetical protein